MPHDGDIGVLAALFNAYRVFYKRESDPAGSIVFVAERLRRGDTQFFIARSNGIPVGFAHLLPSFETTDMRRAWILEDLYVDPDARNLGAGTALLERAEHFARETGAIRMTLTTAVDNVTAQRLYVKNGWKRDERFWTFHHSL
jgi:GNAT superfamily N-acetyltransferase